MKLTPTEYRLLKERVIREYKLKHEKHKQQNSTYLKFKNKLKRVMPLNIIVGVAACIILAYVNGWRMLGYLLLSGIIWLTLITTLVSVFLESK